MRVLVTGHSGFLGSWLSALMERDGHELHGYSTHLSGDYPFSAIDASSSFASESVGDIRDQVRFEEALRQVRPEAVLHLAAEPIVQLAQRSPLGSLSVNAFGTLSILEVFGRTNFDGVFVASTTDKVYLPTSDRGKPFTESDALGGTEPYSDSKVLADLAVSSYAQALGARGWNVFRAGNLVGGGDRGYGRLVPGAWESLQRGIPLEVRNLGSTRPWQHVLDCAFGIVAIVHQASKVGCSEAWNLGPDSSAQDITVEKVLGTVREFDGNFSWNAINSVANLVESEFLDLDSTKAKEKLRWRARVDLEDIVRLTLDWETRVSKGESAISVTREQIAFYRETFQG